MWYKGESVGRLQLRLLLIKKGIEGGNHTIKEWKNIFLSIGIVFNNPEKQIKKNAAAPPPQLYFDIDLITDKKQVLATNNKI